MNRSCFIAFAGLVLACASLAAHAGDSAPPPVAGGNAEGLKFFEAKIRPVLVEHCYKCHSKESGKTKGGLLLDSRAGLAIGGDSGKPAVVPRDAAHSPLVRAIEYEDEDLQMPPKERLTAAQVADFKAWIDMGAPDPRADATTAPATSPAAFDFAKAKQFWSFQPPRPQSVPPVKNTAWPKTDIDRFILARLEAKGIAPLPRADKRTLIRRATFDLTGLPPTPADAEAFLADNSADAFAKVIDRLLASKAYGEKWGRHWLDLARYADTGGDSADYPIPQAFRYRDWVIAAFNRDQPYDQFLREQIAGDLLPARDDADRNQKVIATGFLAEAKRFSVAPETQMHLTIDDTIDTVGRSVLGLTLGCARCHDHKFDPIAQTDYYGLYGIFSSTRYPLPGSENSQFPKDMALLGTPAEAAAVRAMQDRITELDNQIRALKHQELLAATSEESTRVKTELDATKKEMLALVGKIPPDNLAYAVADGKPADAPVLRRGEPFNKGAIVPRGFPQVLGGQKLPPTEKGSGRLELADWLTDPGNPLVARVMVNRIWQNHFGRRIVPTPSDFAARGMPPTHPELLDWLAIQFVKRSWSIKAMHRQIMLSETYQLADETDPAAARIDPTNELHWRFDRRRLEAEEIRDAMLAISGELDTTPGGPHPFPPQSQWSWTQHKAFSAVYETKHRGVYLMVQRIKRHPFLGTFDGADPNAPTAERASSTTPLQALFAMNDPFIYAQSTAFAGRLLAATPEDIGRVELMYRSILGRPPMSEEEVSAALGYVSAYRGQLSQDLDAGRKEREAWASLTRVLFGSNEFMFVD